MSVTTEQGDFPGEEIVRVDGEFAGRIRRQSRGYYALQGSSALRDGVDRSEAVGAVVEEFRSRRRLEREQESLDLAVARDQESYRRAVEADEEDDTYDV